MNKTAEEILRKSNPFSVEVSEFESDYVVSFDDAILAMKEYALQVSTETRKKCAKRATVKHVGTVAMVDKESILDVSIILY